MIDKYNNVRIKRLDKEASLKDDKKNLLSVLSNLHIEASKVTTTKNSDLLVCCNSSSDVDKLFSEESKQMLQTKNCQAIIPPAQKAKRTIILKNCDDCIYDNTVEEIKNEMSRKNEVKVVDIYKFPNKKIIKITLETLEMVNKVLEHGLRLFYVSLPPHSIEVDCFIDLIMCFKCYEIDNHFTSSCPKDPDYKICSICSSKKHTFQNCDNPNNKQCINCNEPHSTLAFSCQKRKEKIKEKRTLEKNKSFSSAVKNNLNTSQHTCQQTDIQTIVQYFHFYMTARDSSDKTTASIESQLNKILQENSLQTISLSPSTHTRLPKKPPNIVLTCLQNASATSLPNQTLSVSTPPTTSTPSDNISTAPSAQTTPTTTSRPSSSSQIRDKKLKAETGQIRKSTRVQNDISSQNKNPKLTQSSKNV